MNPQMIIWGGNLMVALMTVLFAFSFDILKYSEMSCIDAQTLIDRVYEYNQQSEFITTKDADEIVEVIKESVCGCFNEGSKSVLLMVKPNKTSGIVDLTFY